MMQLKDETIITLAVIAGVVIVTATTCVFQECYEIAGVLSLLAGIGGYTLKTWRDAEPRKK